MCQENRNNNECGNIGLLKNLRRIVNITYKTRINASDRLRKKHQYYKKISTYYSILVTAMSIISIGVQDNNISNVVLTSSICLTYYMMYISEQNIQERAYKMEITFKELGDLRHRIDLAIENKGNAISKEECEELFDRYGNILASIENHENIDYDKYKLKDIERKIQKCNHVISKSENEEYKSIKNRIIKHELRQKFKESIFYMIPLIFSVFVFYICIFTN